MKRVFGLVLFLIATAPLNPVKGQALPFWNSDGPPPNKAQTPDEQSDRTLPPGARAAQNSNAERDITELNRQWVEAIIRHDAPAHERILADEYTATGVNGLVATKAQIVMSLRTPPAPDANRIEAMEAEESEVRVYGDVALFSGRVKVRGRGKEQPFGDLVRLTIVYVRRAGRWQPVASHATLVTPLKLTQESTQPLKFALSP